MGKENGQIEEIEGKSEDEIEIESDMPCKVEPTEVETIQEISKVSHLHESYRMSHTPRSCTGLDIGRST